MAVFIRNKVPMTDLCNKKERNLLKNELLWKRKAS